MFCEDSEQLEEKPVRFRHIAAAHIDTGFEKAFSDASNVLLAHLRGKPECRDLVSELLEGKELPGVAVIPT